MGVLVSSMNNIAALLQIRGKIVSVEAMIESPFFVKFLQKNWD